MAKSYEDMLREVLMEGSSRPDRTGTGTTSLFGGRIEYDLRNGFPLITSKRVPFRLVAEELLYFLRGETNISTLQERGVHIWDEWADGNGNLGPMYGHQLRNYGGRVESIAQPPRPPANQGAYKRGLDPVEDFLYSTWKGIIGRCYTSSKDAYRYYGGKGVHVCDEWFNFDTFSTDVKLLEGWQGKLRDPEGYQLDKDAKGSGFRYSPTDCVWLSCSDNAAAKRDVEYTVRHEDGSVESLTSPAAFIRERGLHQGNFSSMLRGVRPKAQGWSLVSTVDHHKGVDQVSALITGIKADPHGRRHVMTTWNPSELSLMALPPCHGLVTQFNVTNDGHLDCQMYQRSADMFLGTPFNIASYALLTHMVAHVTGYGVGRLIWVGGDCHIYDNHRDQVKEQLSREHVPLPELEIVGDVANIDDFTIDNFKVTEYNPHPTLKGVVAV